MEFFNSCFLFHYYPLCIAEPEHIFYFHFFSHPPWMKWRHAEATAVFRKYQESGVALSVSCSLSNSPVTHGFVHLVPKAFFLITWMSWPQFCARALALVSLGVSFFRRSQPPSPAASSFLVLLNLYLCLDHRVWLKKQLVSTVVLLNSAERVTWWILAAGVVEEKKKKSCDSSSHLMDWQPIPKTAGVSK